MSKEEILALANSLARVPVTQAEMLWINMLLQRELARVTPPAEPAVQPTPP